MTTHRVACLKLNNLEGSPVRFDESDLKTIRIALESLLDLIGMTASTFRGRTVLIHPNLVRPNPDRIPSSYTDPRVVIALMRLLFDAGARHVKVGENPGFGFPARQAFREAGLEEPLRKAGAEICYFDEGEWETVANPGGRLFRSIRIAKPVLECDYFINVPKWKTHMLTTVSLSIKNLLGIINDSQRMLFHRNDIIDKIVDLALVRPPDLNIIDGLWAMEGQAPFHGLPITDFGTLAAGVDMTALDITAADLMGFEPHEIPHLALARQRLWNEENRPIEYLGDAPDAIRRRFRRPVLSSAGQFFGVNVIECGVCNGCLSAVRHSLDKLQFENVIQEISPVTIVSGRAQPNHTTIEAWQGRLILFGNCAVEFQFYEHETRNQGIWIPGCPPHVLDLEKQLKQI